MRGDSKSFIYDCNLLLSNKLATVPLAPRLRTACVHLSVSTLKNTSHGISTFGGGRKKNKGERRQKRSFLSHLPKQRDAEMVKVRQEADSGFSFLLTATSEDAPVLQPRKHTRVKGLKHAGEHHTQTPHTHTYLVYSQTS